MTVSEAEVDNYLATVAAQAGGENEYLIAHVMVSVPEQATPDQIDARRKRAEEALAQIKAGKEFSEVAAAFSDAPDAIQGGDLGWRTPARLPAVFVERREGHEERATSRRCCAARGAFTSSSSTTRAAAMRRPWSSRRTRGTSWSASTK